MLRPIEQYFLQQEEPAKSCLLFMRAYILQKDAQLNEAWKYRMPFYCYRGKMACYLWVHEKLHVPYLGIVEGRRMQHPELILEDRARMKILLIDPEADLPLMKIDAVLEEMLALYRDNARLG